MEKPTFAIIGAAGYVAPRHLRAIQAVGGELVAALDPHDSVGVLDQYFPACRYFSEFERFDRFCELFRHREGRIDFVSICSPNYLHDAHCRFALRIGADAICEKPLVLNARNLDQLREAEVESGRRVWNILQIRHHPEIIKRRGVLKTGYHTAKIRYVAPRGRWYAHSWKGDLRKSGGIGTNIGIHLFDAVCHLFGGVMGVEIDCAGEEVLAGQVELEKAEVNFFLSTSPALEQGRVFEIDGERIDLGGAFAELHNEAYAEVIAGRGFGIDEARPAVELAEKVRGLARDKISTAAFECAKVEAAAENGA